MEKDIRIEIGPNLLVAIKALLETVDNANRRAQIFQRDPGRALRRAFNIDLQNLITQAEIK